MTVPRTLVLCPPKTDHMHGWHACRSHEILEPGKLGSGCAVLVGDAAHGLPPGLDIGANGAFSDGPALAAALRAAGGDVSAAAAHFAAARRPAVAELTRDAQSVPVAATHPLHVQLGLAEAAPPQPPPLPFLVALLAGVRNFMHQLVPCAPSWLPCVVLLD